MNAQEMWRKFSTEQNISDSYEAWAFGDDPDYLASLVLDGVKTATASLHLWYDLEKEKLPKAGEYGVILDSREQAVCIIRSTMVYVVPFCEISDNHAFREGEGDRSLAYWRKVHEEFFSEELKAIGRAFDASMKVVCEEFIRVYP